MVIKHLINTFPPGFSIQSFNEGIHVHMQMRMCVCVCVWRAFIVDPYACVNLSSSSSIAILAESLM